MASLVPTKIDEQTVARELTTTTLPDPDLLIRHVGRTSHIELFSVSARLHRTLFHRYAVARFPRARFSRGVGRFSASRGAASAQSRTRPITRCVLRTRLLTAAIALPVLLAAIFFASDAFFRFFIAILGCCRALRSRRDDVDIRSGPRCARSRNNRDRRRGAAIRTATTATRDGSCRQ